MAGRTRAGLTLLEMVIGMAIVSVLLVAMGSSIVMSARALPTSSGSNTAALSADAVVEQVMEELRYATKITEATATSLAFTVADRDGDTAEEQIRYSWDGTAGSPLVREYKGGSRVEVIPSVQALSFGYVRDAHAGTAAGTQTVDSGEVLLATFGSWSGVTATIMGYNLTTTGWAAERFVIDKVGLPADLTRLSISKVSVKARKPASGTQGLTVEVCLPTSAGAATPGARVGSVATIGAAALSTSYAFADAAFTDVVFNDASKQEFVILMKGLGATATATVQYLSAAGAPADNTFFKYSSTSGTTWLPSSGPNTVDAPFAVYGSYQRQVAAAVPATTYSLASATMSIRLSGRGDRMDSATETVNDPVIPAP